MTKIYCDTSNLKDIKYSIKKFKIDGVTTNPSIMRNEGVKDYKNHCLKILKISKNIPLSVEVFADKDDEIIKQAIKISKWSKSIFVKVPVINTSGKFLKKVISNLNKEKIKLNITAIFTIKQLMQIEKCIDNRTPVIISIFSGRIADTGISPLILCLYTTKLFQKNKNIQILWASTREIYNIFEAEQCNCDIITIPESIYQKLHLINKNLDEYSKETVQQFINDGKSLSL